MKVKYFIVLITFLIATVVACGHDRVRKETVSIDPDGEIMIVCPRGDIKIDTTDGDKIRLAAVLKSDTKDEVKKTIIPIQANNKSFEILPGDDLRKSGVVIDYDLQVPKQLTSVRLTALGGNIRARGSYKGIEFKTANGTIDFKGDFTGCTISSANGDIELYAKDELKGNIDIQSTNGSVTMFCPREAAFRIDAFTKTGAIMNDFDLPVKKETDGYRLKGTVKDGNHTVKINTVNGKITLLKY